MSIADQYELGMLELINADRAAVGLDPLRLNTALNAAAEDHSEWMLQADQFSHTGDGGSSAGDRMRDAEFPFEGRYSWAENIGWQSERGAEGIADDVADIHESLMNSPGHRANLLDPNLTEIGIGIETGDFSTGGGTFDGVMITQNFASTDGDISALRDPGTGGLEVEEPPVEDPEPEHPVEPASEGPDEPTSETPVTDEPDMETPPDSPVDVPDEESPVEEDVPTEPEPEVNEPPVEEEEPAVVADVEDSPLSFFFDFADAFEFRQDGETLTFETTFDALVAELLEAIETAFSIDIDEIPEQVVMEPSQEELAMEMPMEMFDCI